ncbi:MAG: alpha/beta fold hydrolase [Solirubrobacterales bacterium]
MDERAGPSVIEFTAGDGLDLRGEEAGEGPTIILCHGITATRRYVVHGSRTLERAGHRVVSYDARGHGESDPAPRGGGYGYPELVGDLEAVAAAEVGEHRFTLAGHSMGAHTAVAYALAHPDRLDALIVIGPVYDGDIRSESLDYWGGLADALEAGGIDGFIAYIDREGEIDPAWRDSVLRFTRERMAAHRHLDAVVDALREVPGSRPFGSMSELEALRTPTLLVASGDDADPGHPRTVAEAYAARVPGARLIAEEEGRSPLSWQGGGLSREIAAFCAANPSDTQE